MSEYGYCECGCGNKTKLAPWSDKNKKWVKGVPLRFCLGHNAPTKSPVQYIVDTDTGCWDWQRCIDLNGYGQVRDGGRTVPAHKVFYEREYGPVPDGLSLDHLCRNPRCVNPDHLEPVSQAENVRRGRTAILTAEAVRDIRTRYRNGSAMQKDLAVEYGLAACTVSNIVAGRSWKDV